jgi:thymidylate synthase (FAD)
LVNTIGDACLIGRALYRTVAPLAPLALPPFRNQELTSWDHLVKVVEPSFMNEIHVSAWLCGSRAWSHEQVRHRMQMSQRSARFCDESESPWHMHPLLAQDAQSRVLFTAIEKASKRAYNIVVDRLQADMMNKGLDALSARKQARGAARGMLGNALETQMIFTASLNEWLHIFRQRLNDAADAEIRVILSELYPQMVDRFPVLGHGLELQPARDGFGMVLKAKAPTPPSQPLSGAGE